MGPGPSSILAEESRSFGARREEIWEKEEEREGWLKALFRSALLPAPC
jgi:hypothetical protein